MSVDPTGDAVAFQAEPIAALLAIGLPGGPEQLPQEHHGVIMMQDTSFCICIMSQKQLQVVTN